MCETVDQRSIGLRLEDLIERHSTPHAIKETVFSKEPYYIDDIL